MAGYAFEGSTRSTFTERYDWPGNVRELRNVVRRAALLAEGVVGAEHLGALHAGGLGKT
jgi:transcriptional regulator with GAF, ATPase, and Fis domain